MTPVTAGLPMLSKTGALPALAVSIPEMREHLRIDGGDEDSYLSVLIRAAQDYVSMHARISLTHQRWLLRLDSMEGECVELPRRPLVIHSETIDAADTALYVAGVRPDPSYLLADADHYVMVAPRRKGISDNTKSEPPSPVVRFTDTDDVTGDPIKVSWSPNSGNYDPFDGNPPLIFFNNLPVFSQKRYSVEIEFTAGFSKDHTGVPEGLKQIIKLMVGSWFINREAIGGVGAPVPFAVDALLRSFDPGEYN